MLQPADREEVLRRARVAMRYAGEARLDYRGANGLDAVTTVGLSNVLSGIELTGANGAAFVKDWSYMNVQQRVRKGRFFVQGFAKLPVVF